MATEKRLIYLEDAIALLEKDVLDSKDALKIAYYGDKDEIRAEMNGVRAAIHILKHHASHGGTVDAVEVVRCKDCKHYDNSEGICWCKLNSKFFPGGFDWHGFPEDGFCSYGERKEDGKE